jgi:hypothetical protein
MIFPELRQGLKRGYKKGEMAGNVAEKHLGQYRHSVFDPRFFRDITQGIEEVAPVKGPVEMAGAYGARLATDLGSDSSRQYFWRYNHPMAVAQLAGEGLIGKQGMAKMKQMTPTQRAGIMATTIGMPAFASTGTFDVTNLGELGRPRGFAQIHPEQGADDRRYTTQPGLEVFERLVLGRRGKPLKYETAKQEIPDLTPQRYGEFMRQYYGDKGLTGLGLLKFTGKNLEGYPEGRILGFPVGLQAVGAVTGGGLAAKRALAKPGIKPRGVALRGGLGALAGMAAGKVTNTAIAAANRPSYPSTLEYQQRM